MNIPNILCVADAIEAGSDTLGFNMGDWFGLVFPENKDYIDHSGHNCGTVACIGGWTVKLFGEITEAVDFEGEARDLLGLDDTQGHRLFYAGGIDARRFTSIQPAHAVRVLRHLAATGEVDWVGQELDQSVEIPLDDKAHM